MSDLRDLDPIRGFFRTHFDCPDCEFDWSEESDKSGEAVECPQCRKKFYCREVW